MAQQTKKLSSFFSSKKQDTNKNLDQVDSQSQNPQRQATKLSAANLKSVRAESDLGSEEEAKVLRMRRNAEIELDNKVGIESEEDVKDIKFLMKTKAAATFNTNVMRIALNMQEEKIASLIVAYYYARIDEEMILRAIKTGQLDFLYCVFAYNKNFQEVMSEKKFRQIHEMASS